MQYYPVARVSGKVFTIEASLMADIDEFGRLSPDDKDPWVYLMISPPIEAGEMFEYVFPDIPDFKLEVKTPRRSLFVQKLTHSWAAAETLRYVQERVPQLAQYLERVEAGTIFYPDNTL